jgi:hypothetical protein
LELDIKVQLHNVPGRPLKMTVSTYQVAPVQLVLDPPIESCPTADCEAWVHVDFPLADVASSGWVQFLIAVSVELDAGVEWYNLPRWFFDLQNGAPRRQDEPSFEGHPQVTIGGDTWLPGNGHTNYSQATIQPEDFPWDFQTGELIPLSGPWTPMVQFGRYSELWATTLGHAMIDPRLHAHPIDQGVVVYDGAGGPQELSIDTTLLGNGQHRLLLSACDTTRPDGIENCGVLVVPFLVANA